ncbi:uncharacterized protein METZ01_LOCUS101085 [marine metagenome]|uniref:Uncharacterized protein n=1 Tax=marine metagenome TaxID=408172 RepID=A0A381W7G2_9ZZZZ
MIEKPTQQDPMLLDRGGQISKTAAKSVQKAMD